MRFLANISVISWKISKPLTVKEGTNDTYKMTPHLSDKSVEKFKFENLKWCKPVPQTSNSWEIPVKWDMWDLMIQLCIKPLGFLLEILFLWQYITLTDTSKKLQVL